MEHPMLIVHAGAGSLPKNRFDLKHKATREAVKKGYALLLRTDDPVSAVEEAVRVMEDDESCNAGYGSVLTLEGEVEMDAMIIRGSDLGTGGVGAVRHIRNPITLAKLVMERTKHALLVGPGAEAFAADQGIEIVESSTLIAPRSRAVLEAVLQKRMAPTTETGTTEGAGNQPEAVDGVSKSREGGGTVGAVAINSKGQLAAATSTGGITAKLPGRVGDTPIPGGGTFCDDTSCGISATGLGEAIMRACLCSRIANFIDSGMNPSEACLKALEYMTSKIPEGDGGAIVITREGEIGFNFNSKIMSWAYIKDSKTLHYGIEKGDDFTEDLEL